MRSIITQSVLLPATAKELFEMYLTPSSHEAFTGAPVIIGKESGSEFSAFGGALSGIILTVLSPSLIVQSWRSTAFNSDDLDSTLILNFGADGDAGKIDLVHLDVPDHDFEGVTEGWKKFYWAPWREYLEANAN